MATSADGILTATYDPTRAAVMLVVDGGMWPSPVTFITVTRTPMGQPTVTVRGLEMYRTAGGWYIGSDGEMPLDTDVTYGVTGYDDDGVQVVVGRVNVFTNPSFETDGAWLLSGSIASITRGTGNLLDGSFSALVTATATPSSTSSGVGQLAGSVVPGQWVAARIPIRPGGAAPTPRARLNIQFRDAADVSLGGNFSATTAVTAFSYTDLVHSAQAPAGAVTARVFLYMSGAASDVPDPNTVMNTDAWIASVAHTQDAALAEVATFFDGDTTGAQWTGAANASTSLLPVPTTAAASTTGAEWGVWLKAPGRVDLTVRIPLATHGDQPSGTQGGSYPVIGGSEVHAWSGIAADRTTIQLRTFTTAQEAALYRLLSLYRVVMIQTGQPQELGSGSEWWFVTSATPSNPGQVRSTVYAPRLHTLQIVRSPVPAGVGLVSTGATYSDVSAAYATYTDLQAEVATYADLMTPGV